ncbi:lysozyme C-like [Vombatus ursinus]|uniref:lysozyme C-like n=1 Tax=Vombatus ursinus TaxID=29139 RepID=UPI000FFD7400|nr:lysozyme C-like [Vombatus ursinus]
MNKMFRVGMSDLNTTATHYNPGDQSTNYGIFQINSHYWCDDGKTPNTRCEVTCSEIQKDNFVKAVNCEKKIEAWHGMQAWLGWQNNCTGRIVSKYLEGCHL